MIFNLDEAAEAYDDFPEEKFREEIAKALRIEEDQIIILRLRCSEDSEKLTVQFGVLKRGTKAEPPYTEEHFVDAKTLVNKMKVIGHLSQIAQLDVDEIQHVSNQENTLISRIPLITKSASFDPRALC